MSETRGKKIIKKNNNPRTQATAHPLASPYIQQPTQTHKFSNLPSTSANVHFLCSIVPWIAGILNLILYLQIQQKNTRAPGRINIYRAKYKYTQSMRYICIREISELTGDQIALRLWDNYWCWLLDHLPKWFDSPSIECICFRCIRCWNYSYCQLRHHRHIWHRKDYFGLHVDRCTQLKVQSPGLV